VEGIESDSLKRGFYNWKGEGGEEGGGRRVGIGERGSENEGGEGEEGCKRGI